MRSRQRTPRGRVGSLLVAAVLALSLPIFGAGVSSGAATQGDVDAAKTQLAQLNDRLSLLVEQYDQAKVALGQAQSAEARARAEAEAARVAEARAKAILSARAAAAYESTGPTLSALLGATSFSQLSDRIQFLGNIAQGDVDAANRSHVAQARAMAASARLATAIKQREANVSTLASRKIDIENGIAQQRALISTLETQLKKAALARAIAARAAAERLQQQQAPTGASAAVTGGGSGSGSGGGSGSRSGGGSGGGGSGSGSGGGPPSPPPPPPPPPPPASGAAAAVAAAKSVIGVPYVWGGADPSVGFDCSGLTMWSWAHGGVSLPHSSVAQYSVLPHVSRDQLQPGDLLFFYTPIHHVAIYVGGGLVVEAHHPGTTVAMDVPDWANYVGAGRP